MTRPNKLVNGAIVPLTDAEVAQIAADAAAPAPVPSSITPRQARLALLGAGLLSNVTTAIAAADEATKIAWEFATYVKRDNPIIAAMAAQLGLTSAQVDDLFRAAAAIGD